MTVQFRVLGPVEAAGGEQRVGLTSGRQRMILATLLAAHGKVVSPQRLIDALWGDTPPASAPKTLRSHVSQLRRDLRALGDAAAGAIVTERAGYRADLDAHQLDAAWFETSLAQAREAMSEDPGKALRLLDEALGQWRGPAFGELADHVVVRGEALRLEQLRATAAGERVEARLALGRHREVLGELEGMAAANPLDERAHGQLMLAMYRSGRQSDALATYRELQARLREDVGVDPSPELQDLHTRMLAQDTDLEAAPARAPQVGAVPVGDPKPGLLSPARPVGELIGREEEVASVASLVTAHALVTLTGPGGVGKTRLAEQVAVVAADQFDDGIAICALSAVREADSVSAALVDALGIEHAGGSPADEALVSALGTRRLLLVLDGCEHLLTTVGRIVEALLARCSNLAVLATSREPLRLPSERIWQVAPLRVPRLEATPAEVASTPAGALFVARAEAGEPTFTLTGTTAGAVAELCRRLDGLPLAIELAAARVRVMAPDDLVARLDQRFSLLGGGPRGEGGRHRTLQAVVAWSYDLLTDSEARLFDRLSVFAGAFPLVAAERVCAGGAVSEAEVAGLLAELVDKSMVSVERVDASARYRLLDTLRSFGAQRLEATGDAEAHRRVHAEYHLSLVEELGPTVRGAGEGAAVAGIDAVIDDLRVAHGWLVAGGDASGALRLPAALHEYLLFRLRGEVFTWAERSLELPGAPAHPAYPAALATAARGATDRGDIEQGRRWAEAAMAQAAPDDLASLRALGVLSAAALYEGRLDDVFAHGERMAALAAAMGEPFHAALAGLDPTLALIYRDDRQAATARAAELERAAETTGNPTLRALALYVHGETLLDTDPAAALPRLESAIEVARQVNSRLPEGAALVSLASLRGRRGEAQRALALFREAVGHWRRLGDHTHQLTTLRNLVEVLATGGDHESAAVLHGATSAASPPSFGQEAERLATAWRQLEQRMGPDRAAAAAQRGRQLSASQMADHALAVLDALVGHCARPLPDGNAS